MNDLTNLTKRLAELREAAYSANTGEVWNAATKAWRDFTFANATAIHAAAVELEGEVERLTADLAAERAGAAALREALVDLCAEVGASVVCGANHNTREVAQAYDRALAAIATTAGRETLADLERLRAENGKLREAARNVSRQLDDASNWDYDIDTQAIDELIRLGAILDAALADGKAVG
jgi:hypothetical protein